MKVIKLTNIRYQKRQRVILRSSAEIQMYCLQCGALQKMLPASHAARILNLSERQFFNLVENNNFHIFETDDGRLFICAVSIGNSA